MGAKPNKTKTFFLMYIFINFHSFSTFKIPFLWEPLPLIFNKNQRLGKLIYGLTHL